MNKEIIADIRNKLQTISLLLEVTAAGKSVPKDFANRAQRDFVETMKLLEMLEENILMIKLGPG